MRYKNCFTVFKKQLNIPTVLLRFFFNAGKMTKAFFSFAMSKTREQTLELYSKQNVRYDLHKYVIFLHNLIETIIPFVDFVKSVIVNICHNHLEDTKQEH